MYIDKIFNKLYSQKNSEGIDRLFSEIRAFASTDINLRMQQLVNTITAKQSRGEDYSKEMAEYNNLKNQVQSSGGTQASGGSGNWLDKFNKGINNAATTVRNISTLGGLLTDTAGTLLGVKK